MKKNYFDKAVTTRFTGEEFFRLQQEAEKQGTTVASVIRNSWQQFQQQQILQQHLLRLEQRQRKVLFEMLSAVIRLQPDERQEVVNKLKRAGIKW